MVQIAPDNVDRLLGLLMDSFVDIQKILKAFDNEKAKDFKHKNGHY